MPDADRYLFQRLHEDAPIWAVSPFPFGGRAELSHPWLGCPFPSFLRDSAGRPHGGGRRDAAVRWQQFVDDIEVEMAPGGDCAAVSRVAELLPENGKTVIGGFRKKWAIWDQEKTASLLYPVGRDGEWEDSWRVAIRKGFRNK